MRRRLAVILAVLALPGCQQWELPFLKDDKPAEEEQPPAAVEQPAAEPRQPAGPVDLGQIVASLQAGDADGARDMLDRYLEDNPESATARDLLRQLEADPEAYFDSESFEYTVEPGDALSEIAARFLGDPLEFYILARYNGLDRPELVYPGQSLRIPGERKPSAAEKKAAREPLQRAERYLAMQDFRRALDALDGDSRSEQALALEGQAYRGLIQAAMADGSVKQARDWLQVAQGDRPESGAWDEWLDAVAPRVQVAYWRRVGERAYSEERKEDALDAYRKAADFAWGVEATRERLDEIRDELVRQYHESALINYRNQRLERAISLWSRALDVDPDFERARVYRERARELKQRLRAFGENARGG